MYANRTINVISQEMQCFYCDFIYFPSAIFTRETPYTAKRFLTAMGMKEMMRMMGEALAPLRGYPPDVLL